MKDKELLSHGSKMLPGSGVSYHQFKEPSAKILQTFPNPLTNKLSQVTFESEEVTALCPLTGFPDLYTVTITYVPQYKCVESKSAKFYLGAFRNYRGFIERIAEKIWSDWKEACCPAWVRVDITMKPRGGVAIRVVR